MVNWADWRYIWVPLGYFCGRILWWTNVAQVENFCPNLATLATLKGFIASICNKLTFFPGPNLGTNYGTKQSQDLTQLLKLNSETKFGSWDTKLRTLAAAEDGCGWRSQLISTKRWRGRGEEAKRIVRFGIRLIWVGLGIRNRVWFRLKN